MSENLESEASVSAPGTIQLCGETYLVAKPTERDVFAVFFHAKKEAQKLFNPFTEVMDSIKGLVVSEDQKTALLLQAHRVQLSREVPEDAITNYLTSPAGCAFYAWMLIRKEHPNIKLEDLRKEINEDNVLSVFSDLDVASGADLIHKAFEGTGFFHQVSQTVTG